MPHKIFIGSSHRDTDLAHDLAKRLDKAGLKVIMPAVGIDAGESIKAKVGEELHKADEVILILTKNLMDSQWLFFVIGYATTLGKHVTPLIQGVDPKELPEIIRQMKYVKYADLDRYITKLQRRVEEPTKSAA